MSAPLAFTKGHGTENDFVILDDPDGRLELDAVRVAALADRRAGIGGDGVIRAVRSRAAEIDATADAPEWFMDYRNADGSVSEMCGNGVRVFARHLVDAGLVPADAPVVVGTRDGDKVVTVDGDQLSVDMGAYDVRGTSKVEVDGRVWEAQDVRTGNPHAVTFVDTLADAGTLLQAPTYDTTTYPEGVNVEFVERVADHHVAMRVHERGSGETRSCGTGACAVGIATALADHALDATGSTTYRVDVPGGTLNITVEPTRVVLAGPARIVATGEMEWIA